ncbi:DegT/DnrJ/EryC1/StrS family aminotransferase [Deltaproteobacteria bacterium TL4]
MTSNSRKTEIFQKRFPRLATLPYYHYLFRQKKIHQERVYLFSHGRTALKYGLKALGMKAGEALLLPDLICETLLYPLKDLGLDPCYYPVNSDLSPCWSELEKRISSSTRALVLVHYFGQPQDIVAAQHFCDTHHLALIEDNAHGFGSLYQGKPLGCFGQIGITSPRKSFALLNGAYLYLNGSCSFESPELPLQPLKLALLRQVKAWGRQSVQKMPWLRKPLMPMPEYSSQDSFYEPPLPDWAMDEWSYQYLTRHPLKQVRSIRREIYALWQEWCVSKGLTPVFAELSPEANPLVFPAYTHSVEESQRWFQWGYAQGIDVYSWPRLPRAVVTQDSDAMHYWRHLLCFPIHQGMNPKLLQEKLTQQPF